MPCCMKNIHLNCTMKWFETNNVCPFCTNKYDSSYFDKTEKVAVVYESNSDIEKDDNDTRFEAFRDISIFCSNVFILSCL